MIGALVRSIEMRVRPKYGRGMVNERGCMTNMVDKRKNAKVTTENRVIIKLEALGCLEDCVFAPSVLILVITDADLFNLYPSYILKF